MMMRTLESLDVKGKRVLVRVDFNVTVENGRVVDDFRLRATAPTILALRDRGAKSILLLSHFGRPEGRDERFSLRPVGERLSQILEVPVTFLGDCVGEAVERAALSAKEGAVVLFENLRFHSGEESNDASFARDLAKLGDCFVNEAFGASHRAHASIVGIPNYLPSVAGLLLQRETKELTRLREAPVSPFVAVMGGAKISDKLPLIERFLPLVSKLCLGGALANTILKARGIKIGKSLVEDAVMARMESLHATENILIPVDAVVSVDREGNAPVRTCAVTDVRENEAILDIGPETEHLFCEAIYNAKTVFWNGPMGRAEIEAFRHGTDAVAQAIAEAFAFSVIGGGDTTQYPEQLGLTDRIGFLSTGGGAMLELLGGATLPGIEALEE